MAIKDSIDNLLIKLNGTAILEDVYEWLEGKYSRETIQRFLENNRNEYEIQDNYIISEDLQIESFIEKLRDSINKYSPLSEEVFSIMISKFINEFKSFISPEKLNSKIKNLKEGDKYFLKEAEHLFFELDYQFYFEKNKRYRFSSRLFNFLLSNEGNNIQTISTPESIIQLFKQLFMKVNVTGVRIYNPAARYLNLATSIGIDSKFDVKIKASEINQKTYEYGQLFAEINDLNVDYSCTDSALEIMELNENEFDFIVSHLPFGVKTRQPSHPNRKYRDLAYHLISESLRKLNNKGKAIFIVPDNLLFSSDKESKMFRKEMVESHTLKSIISLPANLFVQTSVKASILVLDKEVYCNSIQFIDAASKEYYDVKGDKTVSLKVDKLIAEYRKTESNPIISEPAVKYGNNITSFTVPVSVVRDTGYYLNFGRYLVNKMEFEEGYVPLRNILTPLHLAKFTREESISPFIRISELNADIIDSAEDLSQNTSKQKGRLLDKPAILIGKVGGSFKPTWFNASFEVEVSNNIAVLDYDEKKVFIPYLIQELNADYVYTQMKLLATGAAIQHLSNEDLLSVKVRFPELRSEQEKLYNERIKFSRDQKLKQKLESKSISDAELFKTFKHEIGNILKAPEGFLDLLPDFLENNHIKPETPFVKMEDSESIQQMIELSRDRIKRVYAVMENMKGILLSDEKYFKPKNIELKSFIEDCLTRESFNGKLQWYVTINGTYLSHKKVFTEIDVTQFEYLVRNIVVNALEHGKKNEMLHFIVDIVDLKENTLIDFMNDGEPLSSNLNLEDFIQFGKKSGDSKGQGLGGFLINKVIKNHNGVLDILPAGKNIKVNKDKTIQTNVHFSISIPKNL
jgi:type I restriction enzyme M protein